MRALQIDGYRLTLEKVAPRPINSSSTRNGTTFVRPTSSSSPSVKPVTFLPSTSGLPCGMLTWRSARCVADKRD